MGVDVGSRRHDLIDTIQHRGFEFDVGCAQLPQELLRGARPDDRRRHRGVGGDERQRQLDECQTGVVSHGDLLRVQPFGDELLLVTLSGVQVRALLAQQWREDGAPELLQVSRGLSYAWQANDADRGAVVPGSVRVAGRPLDDAATYRVVISSYLAGGGDGFGVLTDAPQVARGPGDVPALGAYLAARSPLSPPSGVRIRRHY